MSITLNLLKLALKEPDPHTWSNVLMVCKDSRLFQKDNSEDVISFAKSLLSTSNTYANGLEVIEILLPQCKSEIVRQHLLQWLQFCYKGLQNDINKITVYTLLRDLLVCSKDYPDVRKQISVSIIPKIIEHFLKNKRKFTNQTLVLFLRCLEEILANYGKACGNWKGKIEHFLLSQLESCPDIVHACAKCFLKLTVIVSNSVDLEDELKQFLNKQKFLVSALHLQLDNLLHPINEIQGTYDKYIIDFDKKCIPEIVETSSLKKVQRSTLQLISLSKFLNVMLLETPPIRKRIHVASILSVVCRGLAVNCKTFEANISNDTIILSSQIPAIQMACLRILDALIQCCRNLYSEGKLICKLLTQTLIWTKIDCEYGQIKPYSLLRVDAYNCFNTWLTISRRCSNVEYHINDILPSLLSDIHSEQPSITLNISTKHLKGNVGKKERKRNKGLTSTESKLPILVNTEANKEICEAALNFIPPLLGASSSKISPLIHKQLQERVVNQLILIKAANRVSLDLPIPYSDDSCRLALYKALLALCNYHHYNFPAPCNYALPIFTEGLGDLSLLVARFCAQAVGNIEKMLQPYHLSLGLSQFISNEISLNSADASEPKESTSQHVVQIENPNGSDTNLNIKYKENDSINVNTTADLFVNQLPESTENQDKNSNNGQTGNAIKITDSLNKSGTHIWDLNDNERKNKLNKPNELIVKDMKHKNEGEREDVTSSVQVLQNKTSKRLSDDVSDYLPQEKKKKDVTHKKDENEITELEAEMLSSFIDIVK